MVGQVSPGVQVREINAVASVPSVSTTIGAFAGHFHWGPVNQPVLVTSEESMVSQFGTPDDNNYESFLSAANFLSYSNALWVVRADQGNQRNAITNSTNNSPTPIRNENEYNSKLILPNGISNVGPFVAKYPGELGNSLKVSVCPSTAAYTTDVLLDQTAGENYTIDGGSKTLTLNGKDFTNDFIVGDYVDIGETTNLRRLQIESITYDSGSTSTTIELAEAYTGDNIVAATANTTITRHWEYANATNRAPGTSPFVENLGGTNDELHVVIVDEDGVVTGNKGQILEVFESVSKAKDAKVSGNGNYYVNVINNTSRYVWWAAHDDASPNAGNAASGTTFGGDTLPSTISFVHGANTPSVTSGNLNIAYDQLRSEDTYDYSLCFTGSADRATIIHVLDNLTRRRQDHVLCFSPPRDKVVNNSDHSGKEASDIISWRNNITDSDFAFMDCNWKYQYDKYNDVYRWVPCNGDTAGTMVFASTTQDDWFSPAGFNRGAIRNVIKLGFNPNQIERDELYKNSINPIATFAGRGTHLFGDRTLSAPGHAFEQVGVRRLFIVLRKAIAARAENLLFEFNDAATRSQFLAYVEPFLRDIQGRRGIEEFRAVCDSSNNPEGIVRRGEFVGDIYVRPRYSINFITLNFTAVGTGVEFNEVVE